MRPVSDMNHPIESRHPRPAAEAPPAVPGRGIVLALNFVPKEVEPAIHAFWRSAARALEARGYLLVIASTTPMDPALNSLPVPYLLTDFATRFPSVIDPASAALPDPWFERKVLDWYRCTPALARTCIQTASAFFDQLITAMRPAAVIGWQSTHPMSHLLLDVARHHDLPTWCAERGWLPHTLMFDVAENNHLSEINRSLLAQSVIERYAPGPGEIDRLKQRLLSDKNGRYSAAPAQSGPELRQRLGIAPEAKVFALFTHSEPLLFPGGGALAELHGMSRDSYLRAFEDIKRYCVEHGHHLLVQEHPFNRGQPHELPISGEPGVIALRENVHTLLDAADHFIFTLSTVQAYAMAYQKSFGLLARSFLHQHQGPHYHGDHPDTPAFMDAIVAEEDWPARQARIENRLAFFQAHFLLSIEPVEINGSAERLARLMQNFERPVQAGLDQAIDDFLRTWSS